MSQSFVFSPEWNGYRPSATSVAQKLPSSVEGKGTPLPFGVPPPIIWLHFLFPFPMSGDPRSLKCEHLCDPHSFLTVTFWLLDNFSSTGGEYHSHLLVSLSHHVTNQSSNHCCSLTIRLFSVISTMLISGGSYSSAKKRSVYSSAPSDWPIQIRYFSSIYIYIYMQFLEILPTCTLYTYIYIH